MISYATSKDRVTWDKPMLGVVPWQGERSNLLLGLLDDHAQTRRPRCWFLELATTPPFLTYTVRLSQISYNIFDSGPDCGYDGHRSSPTNHSQDAGYHDISVFDYSEHGVSRAKQLVGTRAIPCIVADARDLAPHYAAGTFDAILDKGTLDCAHMAEHGGGSLSRAASEFTRVVGSSGILVVLARVVTPAQLLAVFSSREWEPVLTGDLHFAPSGEATIDLDANLFAWRRR